MLDSVRREYPGFDQWLARASAQGRAALVARAGAGDLAAVAIVKEETTHPGGTPGPGTKVCTFKVAAAHRRRGLGSTMLAEILASAQAASHRWVYVSVSTEHTDLLRLLDHHAFTAAPGPGGLTVTRDLPAGGRVALMSIHPRYAEALLAGTKRVELRKRPLAPDVHAVVVYATAPVGRVVGSFTVVGQDIDTPAQIWDRHAQHAGIDKAGYDAYFAGSPRAVAIGAARPVRAATPLPLAELPGCTRPPQSFAYLTSEQVVAATEAGLLRAARPTGPQPD